MTLPDFLVEDGLVTDAQARRLREKRMSGRTLVAAAPAAGMSERAAGRRQQHGALPSTANALRWWRKRDDPFAAVWESEVILQTSGPSRQNSRIYGLEFTARIVDLHLPVDTALGAIGVGGPRRDLGMQRREVADAAPPQALARHRTEFVLRDVQPAAVLRRVAELDATNQVPGSARTLRRRRPSCACSGCRTPG